MQTGVQLWWRWRCSFSSPRGCFFSCRRESGWWSLAIWTPVELPFWYMPSYSSAYSPYWSLQLVFTYTFSKFIICFGYTFSKWIAWSFFFLSIFTRILAYIFLHFLFSSSLSTITYYVVICLNVNYNFHSFWGLIRKVKFCKQSYLEQSSSHFSYQLTIIYLLSLAFTMKQIRFIPKKLARLSALKRISCSWDAWNLWNQRIEWKKKKVLDKKRVATESNVN